jgi:cyclophilin family peptidyl-prolyl cis-trans isomerase
LQAPVHQDKFLVVRKPILAGLLFLLPLPAIAQVYADFQTTAGSFTCELNFKTTPKTVANFMTLADGSRPWLDEQSGLVSAVRPPQPFYDGLIFHRVVHDSDFKIIQAGSRKGDGSDGPGYSFADEFNAAVPASYLHDAPYQLSMANSGLNSNGSQFFITAAATPSLNGRYTVFGKVVSGSSVIDSILAAVTDTRDKPVTPITIQHVTIRKIGTEASRFNPTRITLPKVTVPKFRTKIIPGTSALLTFSQPTRSLLRLWTSQDGGSTWSYTGSRYIGAGEKPATSAPLNLNGTPTTAQLVFRTAITTYPTDSIVGSVLTNYQLYLENESGDYTFHFNATGDSTYLIVFRSGETKTGKIQQVIYEPDGYGATLIIDTGVNGAFRYRLAPKVKSKTGLTGQQRGSFYNLLFGWIPYEENADFALSPQPTGS